MNIKSFSRKVYIALAACFVMLAVAPMTASAQSQEDQIKATTLINKGDKAPDFTVEMVNGEKITLSKLKGKVVLINMFATWCGPCRMLGPVLEEKAKETDKIKFVSVNIDDNEELAEKYNVFTIPCLVLIKEGKEVNRSVGLIQKDALEEFIGE